MKLCGAKTRSGGTCKNAALENGRCRFHGGKSPAPGPGHPNYRHGRKSRFRIPSDLQERIRTEQSSEELTDLRRDLAIQSVRLNELLATIGAMGDLATLQELSRLVSEAQTAHKEDRPEDLGKILKSLQSEIRKGMQNERGWSQVERTSERRRRLAATQMDLATKAGRFVQVNAVLFMFDKIRAIAEENATDRKFLNEFRRGVASVLAPLISQQNVIEVDG